MKKIIVFIFCSLFFIHLSAETMVLYNGTEARIKEVNVVRMEKNGNQCTEAGHGFFCFYHPANMPVITGMRTDFYIYLEEITTN